MIIAALAMLAPPPPTASIAIIVDDLGNRPVEDQRVLRLPAAVAVSLLPDAPGATQLAATAQQQGREYLVHLPMSSIGGHSSESSELHAELSHAQFSARVRKAVLGLPGAIGVNNHQGSLLTQDRQSMDWLMAELQCLGPRLFVDSRTTHRTRALEAAQAAGIASTRRDVFLDWRPDQATIEAEFDRLLAQARRDGHALAIAHPHPLTLQVLEQRLTQLAGQGVQLVPLSTYVETSQWQIPHDPQTPRHAGSWSLWPTAVKSLSR